MKSIVRRTSASLCFLVLLAVMVGNASGQEKTSFPAIEGIWIAEYDIAFPRTHALFPDELKHIECEFEIYHQNANLIWAENRWRRAGEEEWVVEYVTGSFRVGDPTTLVVTEAGPVPVEGAQTGFFVGNVKDERLYLTYSGVGGGATFSAAFERKP